MERRKVAPRPSGFRANHPPQFTDLTPSVDQRDYGRTALEDFPCCPRL